MRPLGAGGPTRINLSGRLLYLEVNRQWTQRTLPQEVLELGVLSE